MLRCRDIICGGYDKNFRRFCARCHVRCLQTRTSPHVPASPGRRVARAPARPAASAALPSLPTRPAARAPCPRPALPPASAARCLRALPPAAPCPRPALPPAAPPAARAPGRAVPPAGPSPGRAALTLAGPAPRPRLFSGLALPPAAPRGPPAPTPSVLDPVPDFARSRRRPPLPRRPSGMPSHLLLSR